MMNKVWYIHKWNIIWQKKRMINTCYNTDEPWKHTKERWTHISRSLPVVCTWASLYMSVCMSTLWCPHRSIYEQLHLCSRAHGPVHLNLGVWTPPPGTSPRRRLPPHPRLWQPWRERHSKFMAAWLGNRRLQWKGSMDLHIELKLRANYANKLWHLAGEFASRSFITFFL